MLQFKKGAKVVTANGEEVGHIDRVVIDPRTEEVTHLVVQKGLIFTDDKVMPVEWVASATEDRAILRPDVGDLQALPNFEMEQFIPPVGGEPEPATFAEGYATQFYWYPTIGAPNLYYPGAAIGTYLSEKTYNIPEGTIALKKGAAVISADGKHVGDIEQVLVEPQEERITHFLISQGLLLKEKKLVPVQWVDHVEEDKVFLALRSGLLEQLPKYKQD